MGLSEKHGIGCSWSAKAARVTARELEVFGLGGSRPSRPVAAVARCVLTPLSPWSSLKRFVWQILAACQSQNLQDDFFTKENLVTEGFTSFQSRRRPHCALPCSKCSSAQLAMNPIKHCNVDLVLINGPGIAEFGFLNYNVWLLSRAMPGVSCQDMSIFQSMRASGALRRGVADELSHPRRGRGVSGTTQNMSLTTCEELPWK